MANASAKQPNGVLRDWRTETVDHNQFFPSRSQQDRASTVMTMSPIERPERIESSRSAGEADALWGMLDYYRATLLLKCSGLDDEQLAQRSVPPSTLTLLGILRHMSDVEVWWFGHVFAGVPVTYAFDPEMIGDDFNKPSASPGEVVGEKFLECVEQSNRLSVGKDLDTLGVNTDTPINLRFIAVHMIEEYARHCGHADLLREAIDGETGD
jgi:hypothetical protein